MIGWLTDWWRARKAKKLAEEYQRQIEARRRIMSRIPFTETERFTPTTAYETFKKTASAATEETKRAREAAQKILRNSPRKK